MRVTKKGRSRENREPKPFKSGLKINTVKSITINPHTKREAYSFIEDDSVVDCYLCVEVKD